MTVIAVSRILMMLLSNEAPAVSDMNLVEGIYLTSLSLSFLSNKLVDTNSNTDACKVLDNLRTFLKQKQK